MSSYPDEFIDLAKCLTSGQVFRWRSEGDAWVGVDGENWYRIREFSKEDSCHSSPLASFFRLDWEYGTPSRHPPPCTEIRPGEGVMQALVRLGPELHPFLGAVHGLRLLRPSCPREALFSFLCTSNNHISRITQMVNKLAAYGEPLQNAHENACGSTRFPRLERIAEISEQELRGLGFGYRAKTIPLVAEELLRRGGGCYLDETKNKPYEDVYDELVLLPGVGPKLADCIALYAFDKTEATPIDVHMWRAACPVYFPHWNGTDLTDLKRRALGEHLRDRFGTLAGLAQQILFYSSLTKKP